MLHPSDGGILKGCFVDEGNDQIQVFKLKR